MKNVTSRDNRIVKLCKQLTQRKYRDKTGMYLIEGPNILRDALSLGVPLEAIIVRSGYFERSRDFALSDMPPDTELATITESLFDEIAETEHSQGIMAIAQRKPQDADEFFEKAGRDGNLVVLDRLQDPGNIGTIIRTADAAGYKGVVAIKGCTDIFSPKVVRAAAGSVFRVPVLFAETPEQAAGQIKATGRRLIATCFDTEKYYFDIDMKKGIALIIGNEGNGISRELISLSDEKIKIPMEGSIDSLNAAVAAGILMYESRRIL